MTTPHLAPPRPDAAPRDPVAPRVPPPPPRARNPNPRIAYGRALRWALLVSAATHAVLLLLTGDFLTIDPLATRGRAAPDPETFAGLEWVVPVPEGAEGDSPPAAPAEEEPAEVRDREVPTVLRVRPGEAEPEPTAPAAAPGGTPAGQGSARDALRPGYRDPRLYVDPKALGVQGEQQSSHEKYMEHLQARIDAVNDSMGAAAAREQAAKDWTFRDKNGKRWGLSEDGLHLGGLTVPRALVPLPGPTGDNQSLEAAREQQRQRDEIRRQEEAGERRDTLRERARAIRERGGGG